MVRKNITRFYWNAEYLTNYYLMNRFEVGKISQNRIERKTKSATKSIHIYLHFFETKKVMSLLTSIWRSQMILIRISVIFRDKSVYQVKIIGVIIFD